MTLMLYSVGTVSADPRDAEMNEKKPMPSRRRKSAGVIHQILPPLGMQDVSGTSEGALLGAWLSGALGVGVPGERETGVGM